MNTKLCICNLASTATERDLRALLGSKRPIQAFRRLGKADLISWRLEDANHSFSPHLAFAPLGLKTNFLIAPTHSSRCGLNSRAPSGAKDQPQLLTLHPGRRANLGLARPLQSEGPTPGSRTLSRAKAQPRLFAPLPRQGTNPGFSHPIQGEGPTPAPRTLSRAIDQPRQGCWNLAHGASRGDSARESKSSPVRGDTSFRPQVKRRKRRTNSPSATRRFRIR